MASKPKNIPNIPEQITVNFRIPVKMPSVLAQHLSAQFLGDFVQLSFFEVILPPGGMNTTEEQLELIKESGVPAECVARINIPITIYPEFVKAFQTVVPAENRKK